MNRKNFLPSGSGSGSSQKAPAPLPALLLLLILALSLLPRLALALYLGDAIAEVRGGTYDQLSYDLLARRLLQGQGFTFPQDWWPYVRAGQPTAFWSYLYTLFLAGIYALLGPHPLWARLLQALAAGLLLPWLLYRLGARIFGRRLGLIAAAIAAIYLYFVHYAASLMAESFYIAGILWTLDTALRLATALSSPAPLPARPGRPLRLGLELGAALALTLLLRQVILLFWALLLLWLIWVAWRAGQVRRLGAPLLAAALVASLLIAPWLARNLHLFQRLTLPNTNAGFAFFWANHPIYGTRFEAVLSPAHGRSYQDLIPPELRHLDEAALDRALLARGLAFVTQDPARYLLLSLSRIPVFFLFWPTAGSTPLSNAARLLSFGLFLPFMILGLALTLRQLPRWRSDGRQGSSASPLASTAPRFESVVLLLLFLLTYTAIHLASWANVRYRLPVDAVLLLFAAYALERLGLRLATLRCNRPIAFDSGHTLPPQTPPSCRGGGPPPSPADPNRNPR